MALAPKKFESTTSRTKPLTDAVCAWLEVAVSRPAINAASAAGRLVSVMEGGYDPVSLGTNVDTHLRALVEAATGAPPDSNQVEIDE